jgi:hypothetical protein
VDKQQQDITVAVQRESAREREREGEIYVRERGRVI